MKKRWIALVLLLGAALSGCMEERIAVFAEQDVQQSPEREKEEVTTLVQQFGKKLQMVSLLAPEQTVRESMQEHYADFVSPALLEKWQSDPQNAPGRLVSSPWPDRIDVQMVEKVSEAVYRVKGEITEITSTELESGGAAAIRPVTLEVRKIGGRWLIENVVLDTYQTKEEPVVYENVQYGFRFALPDGWKGFTIIQDKWEGMSMQKPEYGKVTESGPILSIRHPRWSPDDPRQDIPVMVFTHEQWNLLVQGNFHIGAAPIGPKELGRNSSYVFALPARYNYAFLTGYEEVENIVNNRPLQPLKGK